MSEVDTLSSRDFPAGQNGLEFEARLPAVNLDKAASDHQGVEIMMAAGDSQTLDWALADAPSGVYPGEVFWFR
jgi:hypothetical protein